MKLSEFLEKLNLAVNSKTLYVMGCFGAPMTASNKERYKSNHAYNMTAERKAMIDAASPDTFGFDCVCLVKGILWGWNADGSKVYGGASYLKDGVPDVSADGMIKLCDGVTSDFSNIVAGAFVWMSGHCGVYVGNGEVIECTPKWENRVQRRKLTDRKWLKWGKLPWVDYEEEVKPVMDNVPSDWAKEACDWVVEEGLFNGNENGDFMWHSPVTREQLAQILYNMR